MTSAALAEAPVSSYWCLTAGLDQLLHIGPGGADTFADDGPLDAPSAAGADKAAKQRSKNGLALQTAVRLSRARLPLRQHSFTLVQCSCT